MFSRSVLNSLEVSSLKAESAISQLSSLLLIGHHYPHCAQGRVPVLTAVTFVSTPQPISAATPDPSAQSRPSVPGGGIDFLLVPGLPCSPAPGKPTQCAHPAPQGAVQKRGECESRIHKTAFVVSPVSSGWLVFCTQIFHGYAILGEEPVSMQV